MRTATLTRFCWAPDGVFGRLVLPNGLELWTAEQPWRDNLPGQSCIPPGCYVCGPRRYHAGGYPAVEVRDVPGRTHILIHRGNRPRDVRGCIVVGTHRGVVGGEWAVLESREAHDALMRELGDEEFRLEIHPAAPNFFEV